MRKNTMKLIYMLMIENGNSGCFFIFFIIQVVMKGGRLAAMKFFRTEQDDEGRWRKRWIWGIASSYLT